MNIKSRHFWVAAAVMGACLGVSAPVFAQHGGGGHGGGGGGHSMGGGGGHAGGGGGGHAVGGYRGGGAVGGHFAGSSHFAGANRGFAGSAVGHSAYAAGGYRASGYGARAGYGYPGGAYRHGYSTGAYWNGGYWRGGYWPRAYYGYGYSWFLPILPLAYATYWYSGVPYYYANDVYYTWNPDYNGYTASDPPPVTEESSDPNAGGSALPPAPDGAQPGSAGQVFMYPKNGQSQEQQSTDKRECQQWAASQAGGGEANSADYRRAMMACIEGRGYSAN
jgi:hypothetical protein